MEMRSLPPGALTCPVHKPGSSLGLGFPSGHLGITFAGQQVEAVDQGRSVSCSLMLHEWSLLLTLAVLG